MSEDHVPLAIPLAQDSSNSQAFWAAIYRSLSPVWFSCGKVNVGINAGSEVAECGGWPDQP